MYVFIYLKGCTFALFIILCAFGSQCNSEKVTRRTDIHFETDLDISNAYGAQFMQKVSMDGILYFKQNGSQSFCGATFRYLVNYICILPE